MFTLVLSQEDIQKIIAGLGELPLKLVAEVYSKIISQCSEQESSGEEEK